MEDWKLTEAQELPALAEIPGSLIAMNAPGLDPFSVDTDVVRRAIRGDHQAFTQLFYQTYRYVYTIAAAVLSSEEDIGDAVQDT